MPGPNEEPPAGPGTLEAAARAVPREGPLVGPDAAPEKGASSALLQAGVAQRIACAAFAWAATVAPFMLARSTSWAARAAAVLALVVGVAGPLWVPTRRRIGRHLGISAFLTLTALTWVLLRGALAVERLDPILATIGSLSWGLFAFSWGEPWWVRQEAQTEDASPILRARAELPPYAVPIAAVGVVSSLLLMGLAWHVREPSRALFAQAAAIGVGVALVSVAAHIAIGRNKVRQTSPAMPRAGRRALVALVVAAVIGGAMLVLRSR